MALNVLTICLLISALAAVFVSGLALHRRSVPGAKPFALLMLCVALYALGYALEVAHPFLEEKIFWVRVQYFGIVFIPVLWLFFILEYLGAVKWLARKWAAAWLAIPLVTLLLKLTDDRHGLIYRSVGIEKLGGLDMLSFTPGPWYLFYNAWSFLVIVLGLVFLSARFGDLKSFYRKQARVIMAAFFFPFAAYLFYCFSRPFFHLDIIPVSFVFSGLAVILGFYRFKFLDLAPIARHALIEHSQDGFMVLDKQGRIIDINPVMLNFFEIERNNVIGRDMKTVFQHFPEILALFNHQGGEEKSVVSQAARGRFVMVRVTSLDISGRGRSARLVVAHDVTRQAQAEKDLRDQKSFQELLVRLAAGFINVPVEKYSTAIDRALAETGRYAGVDRVYLFLRDDDGKTFSNTNEWCAPGISPQKENLQQETIEDYPAFGAALMAGQSYHVPLVRDLPPGDPLRTHLEKQDVETLIVLPLTVRGEMLGFVGFDAVTRPRSFSSFEIDLLKVLAEILGNLVVRRNHEKALRKSEFRYNLFFEQVPLGIVHLDMEGRILKVNRRLAEIISCGRPITEGSFFREHLGESPLARIAREVLAGNPGNYECRHVQPLSDHEKYLGVFGRLVTETGNGETGAVLIVQDLTEKREAEEELRFLALHDSLTGLPNRALLYDRIDRILKRRRRNPEEKFVLLYIDIDDFKKVNDRFGHTIGDTVLKKMAERLSSCLRPADLAARLGGDEFAVFLEHMPGGEYGEKIARRIVEAMAKPYRVEGQPVRVTVSIGLCRDQAGIEDPDRYLNNADLAMYRAKNEGKNRFRVFDPAHVDHVSPESRKKEASGNGV